MCVVIGKHCGELARHGVAHEGEVATRLGLHLVENADLVMREGRLWLRALDGLEPIDTVYRRVEDGLLDPRRSNWLAALAAWRPSTRWR